MTDGDDDLRPRASEKTLPGLSSFGWDIQNFFNVNITFFLVLA